MAAALAISATTAVAGCGGSSPNDSHASGSARTSASYGPTSSPAALSRCMRANDVSNFPDPSAGPGGSEGLSIDVTPGSSGLTVGGVSFSGPVFEKAEKRCAVYLPPGGAPPQLSATQKQQDLKTAQCVRKHGIPNFPDPDFNGAGQVDKQQIAASPALQSALKRCRSLAGNLPAPSA
jgi:hypothetical protein